uniref:Uncharacterized protein n=1 Tax=Arundo donax TaxID=35708 RepID=A0A0A9G8K5_ARUDO
MHCRKSTNVSHCSKRTKTSQHKLLNCCSQLKLTQHYFFILCHLLVTITNSQKNVHIYTTSNAL